jgi:hypothetical protein
VPVVAAAAGQAGCAPVAGVPVSVVAVVVVVDPPAEVVDADVVVPPTVVVAVAVPVPVTVVTVVVTTVTAPVAAWSTVWVVTVPGSDAVLVPPVPESAGALVLSADGDEPASVEPPAAASVFWADASCDVVDESVDVVVEVAVSSACAATSVTAMTPT